MLKSTLRSFFSKRKNQLVKLVVLDWNLFNFYYYSQASNLLCLLKKTTKTKSVH
jgi:hypothetical protein